MQVLTPRRPVHAVGTGQTHAVAPPLAVAGLAIAALGAIAVFVLFSNPLPAVAILAVPVALFYAGPEMLIGLLLLAGAGLFPYVDADKHLGSTPVWLICFAGAAAIGAVAWCRRRLAGREAWPLRLNAVLALAAILLAYSLHRLASASPFDIPSISATYLIFPVAALATYVWLSHADATTNLKKVVPVLAVVIGVWLIGFILATVGACGGCSHLVSSSGSNSGLFGPESRLYTEGAGAMLATFICIAVMLRRPSIPLAALLLLGITFVVFQAGRAAYLGFAAGAVVVVAWYFRRSKTFARALVVAAVIVAVVAIVVSPVGSRIANGYQDLTQDTGTPGYRLGLVSSYEQYWSTFGRGVSAGIVDQGLTVDLGIPNTFLVLGYVGGALECALLLAAAIRGLRSGTALGAGIAGSCVMVLATRPTLPTIETGPAALTTGIAVGVVAALPVARRSVARALPRRTLADPVMTGDTRRRAIAAASGTAGIASG